MLRSDTKELLRRYACKYERTFPSPDPSEVMLAAKGDANREATAFVASCLSFGSIKQFLPKSESLVAFAKCDMDNWIRSGAFAREIPDDEKRTFYRFITYANLRAFLCTYRQVMQSYGTLGGYVKTHGDGTGLGAVKAICVAFKGSGARYLVPESATSACKRLCMFLRWMVRRGAAVDVGLWADFIACDTLIMPLDAHVVAEARKLGLLANEAASMATARKLTAVMSEVFPGDPLRGDFALFGHGRETSTPECIA